MMIFSIDPDSVIYSLSVTVCKINFKKPTFKRFTPFEITNCSQVPVARMVEPAVEIRKKVLNVSVLLGLLELTVK